jgi:hypothetical protein
MSALVPVVERITQNVIDTLAAHRSGDGSEYSVFSETQIPESPRDRQIIVAAGNPDTPDTKPEWFKDGTACGTDEYVVTFGVIVYVIKPEAEEPELRQWLYLYAADVIKALGADLHRGTSVVTGGGLALYTSFETPLLYMDASPKAVKVHVRVRYRTIQYDPFRALGE